MILTSLASGPKHGYALTKDIEAFAGARFGPGTMCGAISRLEQQGLIEEMPGDDRRRLYQITAAGRSALASALGDLRRIVDEGVTRLALAAGIAGARA